jgi:hypothetical protein
MIRTADRAIGAWGSLLPSAISNVSQADLRKPNLTSSRIRTLNALVSRHRKPGGVAMESALSPGKILRLRSFFPGHGKTFVATPYYSYVARKHGILTVRAHNNMRRTVVYRAGRNVLYGIADAS